MALKPRDFRAAGNILPEKMKEFPASHPDAFDCLLFRARKSPGTTGAKGEKGVAESIRRNTGAVAYADPVEAKALKIRTQEASGSAGTLNSPVAVMVSVDDVPEQSIILYCEHADGKRVRQVNLYVVKSEPVKGAPYKLLQYYCIPFRGFNLGMPERKKTHE